MLSRYSEQKGWRKPLPNLPASSKRSGLS
jgi:hypothetical protein